MKHFVNQLTRRKVVQFGQSELRRVLGILDLTMLGVGSTIGVGIYVLAGEVSRKSSGPAITISFLIAAVASLFAGLCYAEFGARVPKAGSAYIYTYVCIGEFVAFIIGWNLILEYVIGTASVARGFSQYVNALANNTIKDALQEAVPLAPEDPNSFISSYPDFLSFGLALVLSVALALGVKESSRMNNVFTSINIIVILFVIIAVGTQGDSFNWKIPSDEIDSQCNTTENEDEGKSKWWGTGGFAPYGFSGIMEGAATCFFGFVGFDIIATTGEEAINPSRTIPLSIGISLFIIFLSYFGVSAVITLAFPYCVLDPDAPLVVIFDENHIGWEAAKIFVSAGAVFGFSASLFGAMFPLPRIIYAMASDGLVFRFLAQISKKFQTPTIATALSGIFAGGMAMFFELSSLVDMMSIGTLMAYTIVALCVLLLRYTVDEEDKDEEKGKAVLPTSVPSSYHVSDYLHQLFNTRGLTKPTDLTASLVTKAIMCYCVSVLVLDIMLVALNEQLSQGEAGAITGVVIMFILSFAILLVIARQPESKKKLSFKVPLVPWVPAVSTFINLYLMCSLDLHTWYRFGIWMAIGFLDYFAYGMWNSSLRKRGSNNQGLDNPSFSDSKNVHELIIPKIEIQPATPLSSEPSTPVTKPKQTTPAVPSPLALDFQGKKTGAEDEGANGSVAVREDISPLSAAAVVVSLMMTGKAVERDTEEKKEKETGDKEKIEVERKEGCKECTNDVEGKNEECEKIGVEDERIEHAKEGIDIERKDGDVENDTVMNESPSEDCGVLPFTTITTSLSSSDSRKGNEDTEVKEISRAEEITTQDENESKTKEVKEEDNEDKKMEENSNKKDKSNKPPPFTNSLFNRDTNNGTDITQAYYSSPELSPPHSPPPSPPPSSPTLPASSSPITSPPSKPHAVLVRSQSEANLIRSVPSTPAGRRHPIKKLRRMSSFDDIPPRSPDSPFARRIASFVVIPVHEPEMENSDENSFIPSPSPSLTFNDNAFQDALSKKEDKMFILGSSESLDKLAGEGNEASEFLNTRRMVSRELEVLDPIRERGESKLYANGADKTEIQPS
ncbi:cationic amino acid transporter 3-like isoform X2 [Portunus trituberculatus]|uniref:cationic amino acid transporter 3-like isoform X2 n=1 Tax=Portunus trituberculatus TaxID=210409 RepID=UPI001E1CFCE9|nr:cationic amino acid transporter 3-like isoform X2 [Portunus trituberculatus]